MTLKIVKEPSTSFEYIFFNVYKDGRMLSSHSTMAAAEIAIEKIISNSKLQPELIKEITL
jgi:hypothetical protein